MNILLIGYGYLGRAACRTLRAAGHLVTGVTRSQEKLPLLKKELERALLWNEDTFVEAFYDQDACLFCAAPDDKGDYETVYYQNALRILTATLKYPRLRHVVYTSSFSVYGEQAGKEVEETSPLQPGTPEAEILVKTEEAFLKSPRSCILRLGELVGPGRTLEMKLRSRFPLPFPGTGENVVNLTPLSEGVRAIQFAFEKPLFGIYNVCSDLHPSRKELYEQIAAFCKMPAPRWDTTLTSSHTGNRKVSNEKIKKAGFVFKSSLWEGIVDKGVGATTIR
jgi:nucleoside-diphosphate-sugar epimerase